MQAKQSYDVTAVDKSTTDIQCIYYVHGLHWAVTNTKQFVIQIFSSIYFASISA